jgi:hypothetical protein
MALSGTKLKIFPGRTKKHRSKSLMVHKGWLHSLDCIIHLETALHEGRICFQLHLFRMTKAMEAILAWRFAPLNFLAIPGFPNLVPPPSKWMDYLPTFKEDKEDNPTQHLIKFHQCMDQLDLHHEDVLMKMFMYSLKGDA